MTAAITVEYRLLADMGSRIFHILFNAPVGAVNLGSCRCIGNCAFTPTSSYLIKVEYQNISGRRGERLAWTGATFMIYVIAPQAQ
ncbi:site-specific phage recombinase/integrase domain protein [Collimonas fungivorans]|uniref:Site-specific phage recombinase/integrase domain protein n=1 Tax=Collimonas fungivorans TaxID=158899 RepID=A0A127P8M4_9BURK|nr:site-specific phage recombinase/integrase domain protein [Collimonas fungivorans]